MSRYRKRLPRRFRRHNRHGLRYLIADPVVVGMEWRFIEGFMVATVHMKASSVQKQKVTR